MEILNTDGLQYLKTIEKNSIDLILTDPPYIISKNTGMNKHYNMVKKNIETGVEFIKTEEDWNEYKKKNNITDDKKKKKLYEIWHYIWKKICNKN